MGLIKDGHLLEVVDMKALAESTDRYYTVAFKTRDGYEKYQYPSGQLVFASPHDLTKVIKIEVAGLSSFINSLKEVPIRYLAPRAYTLESRFQELIIASKEDQ